MRAYLDSGMERVKMDLMNLKPLSHVSPLITIANKETSPTEGSTQEDAHIDSFNSILEREVIRRFEFEPLTPQIYSDSRSLLFIDQLILFISR